MSDDRLVFEAVLAHDFRNFVVVGVDIGFCPVHHCFDPELRRQQTFDDLLGKLVVSSSLILFNAIAHSQRLDGDSSDAVLESLLACVEEAPTHRFQLS